MEAEEALHEVKVTWMLADHADVANGKLYIAGGGWTITGPAPSPFAHAINIELPRNAGPDHTVKLELINAHGQPVLAPTPQGMQPVVLEGELNDVQLAPEAPADASLTMPIALNVGPLPLAPGGRYEWRLWVDGETHQDWRIGFNTRPAQAQQAA